MNVTPTIRPASLRRRKLKEEETVEYLKAVACARMGRIEEGKAAFGRACELQPNFEYRGNLDPEIHELITTQ